ncbi:unnamed protein product [Laminaria digitata]
MSSKWTSDDEGKSDAGVRSPQGMNSPTSEQKDGGGGGGRRSRRPRPGRDSTSAAAEDASTGDVEKPDIKTRTGGWGLHGAGSADAQRKSVIQMEGLGTLDQKGTGRAAARRNHFDNDETEILLIPDLETDGEDDIVSKVAAAPKNTSRRVPSLRELDEDLKSSLPSAADGLDMTLLTKTLVPREMLEEADVPWDFDSLLQSITQDLNAEKRLAFESGAGGAELDNPGGISTLQERGSGSRLQGGGSRSSRALVA